VFTRYTMLLAITVSTNISYLN